MDNYTFPIVNDTNCDTYNSVSFKDKFLNSKDLFIVNFNIRSFNANIDELIGYLNSLGRVPDIIILTETWFSPTFTDDLDGFNSYHSYRQTGRGGGVSVYINSTLDGRIILKSTLCNEIIELCHIEILLGENIKVIVYSIYRPPGNDLLNFISHIDDMLSDGNSDDLILVVGDLNIDLLQPDNIEKRFIDNMNSVNFLPLITRPTRVTEHSASLIDHIWCNSCIESVSGVIECNISDHFITFLMLPIDYKSMEMIEIKFRDHSEACLDKLRHSVQEFVVVYNRMCRDLDYDGKFKLFSEKLYSIYDKCCPIRRKNISFRRLTKPWLTHTIMYKINRKHELYRHFCRGSISRNVYNIYRNRLSRELKYAKKSYFNRKFEDCSNDIKKTWGLLKKLMGTKTKLKGDMMINHNGQSISNKGMLTSLFNDHFVNVGRKLDASIPQPRTSPIDYMGPRNLNSFFFHDTNPDEISRLIKSFPNKKCSTDTVPVYIIKHVIELVSPVISSLFNQSISLGIFPEILKLARVLPLFKSGSLDNLTNYRPISLLPLFSKLFEKLAHRRLNSFLTKYKILSKRQFGFQRGYSTTSAIVEYLEYAYEAFEKNLFMCTVFLDFSKAFDTVRHDILLMKLDHIGIRGVCLGWFTSFLTDRKQYVSIGGCNSSQAHLSVGVPQGSTLGPMLFLLYINDMFRSVNSLKMLHFADDTTLFHSSSNIMELESVFNNELKQLDEWLIANRLSLNVSKTKCMYIYNRKLPVLPVIKINNRVLGIVDSHKFLGIVIDNRLRFEEHIDRLSATLARSIGVMHRVSKFVTPHTLRSLYYSLVYSRISYAVTAWGSTSHLVLCRVKRLVNRAVKLLPSDVVGDVRYHYIANDVLGFDNIYKYFILCHLFKILKFANHEFFIESIDRVQVFHSHVTRNQFLNVFNLPFYRKSKTQNSFLYVSLKFWNLLPLMLRDLDNFSTFKNKLKLFLLQSQL